MSTERPSTARGAEVQDATTMPLVKDIKLLNPCAATASMFLYAQGSSVVCCHHDTLTIDRRFSRHAEEIQLLAVDNHSEMGAGRLVVSYDAGQTAIVWDLMTGDEMARFASYDHLTATAWMRNGNVAFGNSQGSIILFEPTTSEHISSRTIDQIAVTAIAPSSDCRTFAIGYQNGSLLIATLQPRFTILHNLTTSRGPSPVVTLGWHASSPRQISDMLAVQTLEGDLRVWSVAKSHSANDPAKVVRILRRGESVATGPNWMGWSKNGRIIQFSDSETLSWDVRTKHVTSDSIPTLEYVKGLAVYGPGASLFTVGKSGTVQQFDLNSPSIMVANVQHPANLLPPSPPVSVEEPGGKPAQSCAVVQSSESDHSSSSVPVDMGVSESDEDQMSPFARFSQRRAPDAGSERAHRSTSPISSRSDPSSISRSSNGARTPGRPSGSLRSRGLSDHTYISAGSPLMSSVVGRKDADGHLMGYSLSITTAPSMASSRSRQRPSRLRNEVPRSPDDGKVHDLFKFTRTRLSDIPYKHPMRPDNSRLTNDDLRRQMLRTIFGWHEEIEDLIQDELTRHPAGSPSRILLSKWLGDMEPDIMAGSSENMTSSDWMLLALSGIGGRESRHKLEHAYVRRLLESGDVHAAVTIMLGMGDHNDAIEVYISHRCHMEALILACLAFPSVWQRQAAIIRRWGEWAVQHGQQQLAIRCFACTDEESSEPWSSPSAAQLNFQTTTQSGPEVFGPPLSPLGVQRGPQRAIAKSSALRLITSFGEQSQQSKFYSQRDGGKTPIAAAVTPIAESAISPGGSYNAATAFLRPSNGSRFNTPTSARAGGPNLSRSPLPSIGELPSEINRAGMQVAGSRAPETTEARPGHARNPSGRGHMTAGVELPRSATADPTMTIRDQSTRAVVDRADDRAPSPKHGKVAELQVDRPTTRNGSRDRIPPGVNLLVHTEQATATDVTSPEQSIASSRFHWPTRRRGPGSVASSITSNSSAGRNLRSHPRQRDDYIHSLETAHHYSKRGRSRHNSKERVRDASRGRHAGSREGWTNSREASEERGRTSARAWTKAKRSPTSPIPMSPEDLLNLSVTRHVGAVDSPSARNASVKNPRPDGRTSSRGSNRRSPDGRTHSAARENRGRLGGRDNSRQRPSSPPPLPENPSHYQGSEDEEDYKRAVRAQESFREKHSRSGSRAANSPIVPKRDDLERQQADATDALEMLPALTFHRRAASTEHAGDLRQMKDERQRKKEQAARELEERRKSLAKRPQAPQIPHPNDIPPSMRIGIEAAEPKDRHEHVPPRCATEPPRSTYMRSGLQIGLPATPKVMRLIIEAENRGKLGSNVPLVPELPRGFLQGQSSSASADKEEGAAPLTLLPPTVYQPPARPAIPRSMSAPIFNEPDQARHERMSGEHEVEGGERRRSHEEPALPASPPPPPPPPPPVLKELQHLALPPPPPPAPQPHSRRPAIAPNMIEIIMDDDDNTPDAASTNDGVVPALSPPPPPPTSSSRGHIRGRSVGDDAIPGRWHKATDRLRSVSRGPKDAGRGGIRSPATDIPVDNILRTTSQVKSSVAGVPPPAMHDADVTRSPVEATKGKRMSTGLHRSEMI
ncbi:uncharacterized protein DCS_07320 [Drechmeria coniospora]|uniref:Gem-associated protein 5 TPR domain-containing protein n=1 Tax=Drechmeria coniospora TaxID=98403 RepID=A0A151GE35_DRECN|nr:uncharacterized protein DCS_07320 [Drechmeria coniospora]KYK55357.1 uncharacterized protein DCS_07320 [Drechmeria coniospora]